MSNKKKNNGYLYKNLKDVQFEMDEIPLKEYPRPGLKRDSYLSLNGEWDIEISLSSELPTKFNNKVIVPYTIETPLSGVNHLLEPNEFIYYHKKIDVKDFLNFDEIHINFDGVDQICDVFINDVLVKSHSGGYTKFFVDVKKYIGNNSVFDLILRVKDYTDREYYSRGKQTLNPNHWFYTSSSGVYKPIWIEGVNKNYIQRINYVSDFDNKKIDILVSTELDENGIIIINDKEIDFKTNNIISIDLSNNFNAWDIFKPYLYNVKVKLKNDEVTSYFGIRKIETRNIDGQDCIYLNNRRIYLNGVLDQGYYYLGFLTPKSYDDYYFDLTNIKDLGYNCIRKHIKVECDMFYYYADLLGILVVQDFPNGGYKVNNLNKYLPGISYKIFNHEGRLTYSGYGRNGTLNRNHFKSEIFNIYRSLYSFPSIICFTIFNESWGEFEPKSHYERLKEVDDKQHLFDTASGWIDCKESDFFSIHSYYFVSRKRKDPFKKRPYILSETGGIGLKVGGHFDYPSFYGHHNCQTKEEYNVKYEILYRSKLIPLMKEGLLNGVIYTQLSDCETEGNGIYTFDRKVLKLERGIVKSINDIINKMNQ